MGKYKEKNDRKRNPRPSYTTCDSKSMMVKDRKHIEFQWWEVSMVIEALKDKIKDIEHDRFNRSGYSPEHYNVKIRYYVDIIKKLEQHIPKVNISLKIPEYRL